MPRLFTTTPTLSQYMLTSPPPTLKKEIVPSHIDAGSKFSTTSPDPFSKEITSTDAQKKLEKEKLIAIRVNRQIQHSCGLVMGESKTPLDVYDEFTFGMIRLADWLRKLPTFTSEVNHDYHHMMAVDAMLTPDIENEQSIDSSHKFISSIVNGADRARETLEKLHYHGAAKVEYVDIGCLTDVKSVTKALYTITTDKDKVSAILVNLFGGFISCDVIAQGIIQAARELDLKIPIVVRLQGTKVEDAKALIANSQLRILPCDNLDKAAKMVVKLSNIVDLARATNNYAKFELSI